MTTVKLHHGDCLYVLRGMPDNSVDSIVTDPPYGLRFMSKKWDYDVPDVEIWAECLRVLKPGGHLLAFAGTRTQHRMAVRIEDAGFEIRDMIAWVYGSGFPKSTDIAKSIDAGRGASSREFTDWLRSTGITRAQIDAATQSSMSSHWLSAGSQSAVPTPEKFNLLRPMLPPVPEQIEHIIARRNNLTNERLVVGLGYRIRRESTVQIAGCSDGECAITNSFTDEAREWEGWGTALKPALEPITVARKPFKGTVAANVLVHGTGALNIDACRIATDENLNGGAYAKNGRQSISDSLRQCGGMNVIGASAGEYVQPEGRWPANLIHDGSDEVVQQFPKSSSRFFYAAKASRSDRDSGLGDFHSQFSGVGAPRDNGRSPAARKNNHPTVKPTDLMRYLCRLVTPPGGVVLDPFMGSGSTGKAAVMEGFNFIGIEREAEYIEIARARIADAQKKADAA
ncbi:site-specific DNA-methyltransferase [Pectobacterium betavasculorum]|uniref:DNA-methyltransferase n=1 Tax=Pectobacterium betavasculorum TaxID=55207 RepID=UPI00313B4761